MKHFTLLPVKDAGFTLVELLLVVAVIGILTSIGIASFISYSNRQDLGNTSNELYSSLNSAKSRAQSQVKPTTGVCSTSALLGIRLKIYRVGSGSTPCASGFHACSRLYAVCGSSSGEVALGEVKNFSKRVNVNQTINVMFSVLSGDVVFTNASGGTINPGAGGQAITLTRDPLTQTIRVYLDGRITVE